MTITCISLTAAFVALCYLFVEYIVFAPSTVPGCIGGTNAYDKTGDPLLSAEEEICSVDIEDVRRVKFAVCLMTASQGMQMTVHKGALNE